MKDDFSEMIAAIYVPYFFQFVPYVLYLVIFVHGSLRRVLQMKVFSLTKWLFTPLNVFVLKALPFLEKFIRT